MVLPVRSNSAIANTDIMLSHNHHPMRRMHPVESEDICDSVMSNNLVDRVKSCTISPPSRSISPPITPLIPPMTRPIKQNLMKVRTALPFDFTGTWQTKSDLYHRCLLIGEINNLVLERALKKNKFWSPSNTRHIELLLYRSAKSLNSYMDRSTLKIRLDALSRCIMKAKMKWGPKQSSSQGRGSIQSNHSANSVLGSFPATHASSKIRKIPLNQQIQSDKCPSINFNVNLNQKNPFAA
uniref:Uncharacterized protein n=1 Tax=Proboscia inermis TaxID=420281 RepID=A0A7S0BXB6_9STRA|mmetsp:Transcript_14854/g.15037  ORF Transcript_14854/g.15037 Transcript_14854/m.15037 type:complete len:239 (+) Transcript_14854:176-892(+)